MYVGLHYLHVNYYFTVDYFSHNWSFTPSCEVAVDGVVEVVGVQHHILPHLLVLLC